MNTINTMPIGNNNLNVSKRSDNSVRSNITQKNIIKKAPLNTFQSISNPKFKGTSIDEDDLLTNDEDEQSLSSHKSSIEKSISNESHTIEDDENTDNETDNDEEEDDDEEEDEEDDDEDEDDDDDDDEDDYSECSDATPKKSRYERELEEKERLINSLDSFKRQGYDLTRSFSTADDLKDLQFEVRRLKRINGVKTFTMYGRTAVIGSAASLELFNNKYNSLYKLNLDGFSSHVFMNISQYDGVLEELYDKYGTSIDNFPPEIKFIYLFIYSAIQFHITNKVTNLSENIISQKINQRASEMLNNPSYVNQFNSPADLQQNMQQNINENVKNEVLNDMGAKYSQSTNPHLNMMGNAIKMGQKQQQPSRLDSILSSVGLK